MQQALQKSKHIELFSQNAEILGSYVHTDSSTWQLGLLNSIENETIENTIKVLINDCSSLNVFYDLPILKAAIKYLAKEKIQFLFLSCRNGNEEILKLFMPVTLSSIGIFRRKVIRSWTYDYAPLGMPIIASENNNNTFSAFIECIKNANHKKAKAIVIDLVSKDRTFVNYVYKSKTLSDRMLFAARKTRAGVKPTGSKSYVEKHFSGKRKQRLRKATRELEAIGSLSFTKYSDKNTIEEELENFLALEAKGWKGKEKTALKSNPENKAFCKAAVYGMADKNQCYIHTMKLNNEIISSLITYHSNGYYYPWKIAYDETYAKYSAGNLLAVHATTEFVDNDNFKGLDSLAAEYNKTAIRLWPDEKEFFTMVIGIGKNVGAEVLATTNELNRIQNTKSVLRDILKK